MAKKWNFKQYGLVSPFRILRTWEIARGIDPTERAVYQIVRDLEENGLSRSGASDAGTFTSERRRCQLPYTRPNIAQMITALRRSWKNDAQRRKIKPSNSPNGGRP
jgi:hypothetical protein